jgi:hypothetical protein
MDRMNRESSQDRRTSMRKKAGSFSRRGFVGGTVALSGLVCAPLWASTGQARDSYLVTDGPIQPFRFVVDQTLPTATAIAVAAVRQGHTLLPVSGDPGPAWINVIEPRLRRAPAPLAGVRTGATLFCLEYLARDFGLRPAYRIEDNVPDPDLADMVDLSDGRSTSVFTWLLAPQTMLATLQHKPDRNK